MEIRKLLNISYGFHMTLVLISKHSSASFLLVRNVCKQNKLMIAGGGLAVGWRDAGPGTDKTRDNNIIISDKTKPVWKE